jgi:hypothetical protein
MDVLVDTPVWSLAFRRKKNSEAEKKFVGELVNIIERGDAVMVGPVRQEVLSGIPDKMQFDKLRNQLRAFPDLQIRTEDYETAAEFFNKCRARGIQGSFTDFLICAATVNHELAVFTTDLDFGRYSKALNIKLYDLPI